MSKLFVQTQVTGSYFEWKLPLASVHWKIMVTCRERHVHVIYQVRYDHELSYHSH